MFLTGGLIPPAGGLGLRLLDTRVALAAHSGPLLVLGADVVRFGYHPEPLATRPAPLLRAHAVALESHVQAGGVRTWADWASAQAGLTLAEGRGGADALDVALGADVRSTTAPGGTRTWLAARRSRCTG